MKNICKMEFIECHFRNKVDKNYRFNKKDRKIIGDRIRNGFTMLEFERTVDFYAKEWTSELFKMYLKPKCIFAKFRMIKSLMR